MWIEIVLIICVLCAFIYKNGTSTYDHWEKLGVIHDKPWIPYIGNTLDMVLQKVNPIESIEQFYYRYRNKRFNGIYFFKKPVLFIRDIELIKKILVKDFDHFTNRNTFVDEETDPMMGKNLLNIKDQKWRDSRNILSPTFTSSKMKNMFHLVDEIGLQLAEYVTEKLEQQKDENILKLEFKDLFTRFTNDVIATTAFGIKVDSLKQPENEFYMTSREVTTLTFKAIIRFITMAAFPAIMRKLKIPLFGSKTNKYYTDLIQGTVRERDEKHIVRPDVLHLMMQARTAGKRENGEERQGLTEEDIIAQCVLFFFAGFETVSVFLGFAAYELALNPDVQERLQKEIDEVIERDGGKLTYEGVMTNMKYLEQVACEVLRLWPPAPFVDRAVSKTYKIEAKDDDPEVILKRDELVWIPAGILHLDSEYFPEPRKFDPERFNEKNKENIQPFTYMPFGMGPRNCIGMRFALMEGKICLVRLLQRFTITVIPETQIPLKLKTNGQMGPEKGYWLGLKKRT